MHTANAIELIRGYLLELIPDLSDEAWQRFLSKTVVKTHRKNEIICHPGMVCNYVSYVVSGLVRSYYMIDGKEIITAFAPENCYCSDYESFLAQEPAKKYTQALEDTIVINVSYNDLQDLYQEHPECEKVGRLIAENLFVVLANRNSSFQFDTPEARYSKFLVDHERITQRVPQYMIASYLGITPEALSRIRSRMSRKGKLVDSD